VDPSAVELMTLEL